MARSTRTVTLEDPLFNPSLLHGIDVPGAIAVFRDNYLTHITLEEFFIESTILIPIEKAGGKLDSELRKAIRKKLIDAANPRTATEVVNFKAKGAPLSLKDLTKLSLEDLIKVRLEDLINLGLNGEGNTNTKPALIKNITLFLNFRKRQKRVEEALRQHPASRSFVLPRLTEINNKVKELLKAYVTDPKKHSDKKKELRGLIEEQIDALGELRLEILIKSRRTTSLLEVLPIINLREQSALQKIIDIESKVPDLNLKSNLRHFLTIVNERTHPDPMGPKYDLLVRTAVETKYQYKKFKDIKNWSREDFKKKYLTPFMEEVETQLTKEKVDSTTKEKSLVELNKQLIDLWDKEGPDSWTKLPLQVSDVDFSNHLNPKFKGVGEWTFNDFDDYYFKPLHNQIEKELGSEAKLHFELIWYVENLRDRLVDLWNAKDKGPTCDLVLPILPTTEFDTHDPLYKDMHIHWCAISSGLLLKPTHESKPEEKKFSLMDPFIHPRLSSPAPSDPTSAELSSKLVIPPGLPGTPEEIKRKELEEKKKTSSSPAVKTGKSARTSFLPGMAPSVGYVTHSHKRKEGKRHFRIAVLSDSSAPTPTPCTSPRFKTTVLPPASSQSSGSCGPVDLPRSSASAPTPPPPSSRTTLLSASSSLSESSSSSSNPRPGGPKRESRNSRKGSEKAKELEKEQKKGFKQKEGMYEPSTFRAPSDPIPVCTGRDHVDLIDISSVFHLDGYGESKRDPIQPGTDTTAQTHPTPEPLSPIGAGRLSFSGLPLSGPEEVSRHEAGPRSEAGSRPAAVSTHDAASPSRPHSGEHKALPMRSFPPEPVRASDDNDTRTVQAIAATTTAAGAITTGGVILGASNPIGWTISGGAALIGSAWLAGKSIANGNKVAGVVSSTIFAGGGTLGYFIAAGSIFGAANSWNPIGWAMLGFCAAALIGLGVSAIYHKCKDKIKGSTPTSSNKPTLVSGIEDQLENKSEQKTSVTPRPSQRKETGNVRVSYCGVLTIISEKERKGVIQALPSSLQTSVAPRETRAATQTGATAIAVRTGPGVFNSSSSSSTTTATGESVSATEQDTRRTLTAK